MTRLISLLVALFIATSSGYAVEPEEMLKDPLLEQRAREISAELRCLVCQNQSIDDSDAQLAKDLRLLVRERLVKGESDNEVTSYVVSRYGDFVLLKPPLDRSTYILWYGPVVIVCLGLIVLILMFRRQPDPIHGDKKPKTLSPEEQKRLNALLGKEGDDDT